jgi:squalene-associated FAD-dependent desaturase
LSETRIVIVGGGLAGMAAALAAADGGAHVTVVERRAWLGGLTWSFRHGDRWYDNGQHVFLRCCTAYLDFLKRIDAMEDVVLQDRLEIAVLRPGRPTGWLRKTRHLPAPLHLAPSLARYPHLGAPDRFRLARATLPLARLDLDDPALDGQTFEAWLSAHGQRPRAMAALWNLITLPTVNLPAAEASLALAAKVFQTGLLTDPSAADIGWSRVPLGRLHGERGAAALTASGVDVRAGERVLNVEKSAASQLTVLTERRALDADAVIVALPHHAVNTVAPGHGERLDELGVSPIVNVHVLYDRKVTDLPFAAAIDSPVQWVFDRTTAAGVESGQYLAVSLSAADEQLGQRPEVLAERMVAALADLFPSSRAARVVDTLVTRERTATFRARPGTAALRLGPRTATPGLFLAGAWTDTKWPATMEGAVRSGVAAAHCALIHAGSTRRLPVEVA